MDVLRLSEDHHDWLRAVCLNIADNGFPEFVDNVALCLLNPGQEIKALEISDGERAGIIKRGTAALGGLFIEASKRDSAPDAVGLYLQAVDITEHHCKVIVDCYKKRKLEIRRTVCSVGFSLPQVVDVNWRLDYAMTSKNLSRMAEPRYKICLETVSKDSGLDCVAFGASVEELQEIVWKLREAVKSVEKHAGSS